MDLDKAILTAKVTEAVEAFNLGTAVTAAIVADVVEALTAPEAVEAEEVTSPADVGFYVEDDPAAAVAEAYADAFMAHYDDDPSPYAGTYSEE